MQLGVEGWVTYRQSRGGAHALVGDGVDLTHYMPVKRFWNALIDLRGS
jgi:hypothetical protein